MARQLAEGASGFKGIGEPAKRRLTKKNKAGTLFRPSSFGLHRIGTKQVRYGCATKQGTSLMLAPIATLVFLSALWLAAVVVTEIFSRSGSRIAAALRGKAPVATGMSLVIRSRPARARMPKRQPMRAQPQLRAAA